MRSILAACLAGLVSAGLILVANIVLLAPSTAAGEGPALGPGGIGALAAGAPAGFVGSAACAGCHSGETHAWLTSQHAHAMSEATAQTVLGDFADVRLEHKGTSARFFRDGARFIEAQAGQPLDVRWRRLWPLLSDPVLGVRIAVAGQLADQPLAALPAAERDTAEAAFRDYEAAQRLNADRVEGRANLGGFLLRRGDVAAAEAEFRAGLKLRPGDPTLSVNLADLYRLAGRERDAQEVLEQAIRTDPDAAAPHHALALGLIRQKRYGEALAELGAAVRLAPDNARYAYVYAVALQSLGRAQDSAAVVAEALRRRPNDADLLTLALNEALQSGDLVRARRGVETGAAAAR